MKYHYLLIQLCSWGLLYSLMALAVYKRPVFVETELLYGAVLVGSTALGSHFLRCLYRRYVFQANVVKQAVLLILGSTLFAAIATGMLLLTFFTLSATGVTFPIPPDQRWFVISSVFSGNFVNMLLALWLWSALYFAVTKVRQLRQTTALLQQTQLDALLNQLNPHFLFNVINNIRALILEDPERSRTMLATLSDMLRYNLSQEHGIKVTLQQELETVGNYINLCSIQFEHRLSYQEDIAPDCKQALVPKLLLQLGVENAVKHGVSPLPQGGQIRLSVQAVGQQLCIKIINPGLLSNASGAGCGVGLENIRRRLLLLYQGRAYCKLFQQSSEVVLEIGLPLEFSS